MYQRALRPDELMHHGILGQRWGVRRFQNKDGTLTRAGRRRMMNNYDYKQTDRYKNASKAEKARMTSEHNNVNWRFLNNEKVKNRIDYKVYEEGKNRKSENSKEIAKAEIIGTTATIAIFEGKRIVDAMMRNAELGVNLNNAAVSQYGSVNGLNTVNGGATSGVGSVVRGRKIMKEMFGI